MATRFLNLKSKSSGQKVSVAFIFGFLLSTVAVNLFIPFGLYYFLVMFASWGAVWLFTSGDQVKSRRSILYSFRHNVLTPNFEDKKCLYNDLEDLQNLKGVLLLTDKNKEEEKDDDENWEEYS